MLDATDCACRSEQQIAALPLRLSRKRGLEVLMITSRDTGRWVMPKGWPMDGKKPWTAVEIEALEEAGARGFVSKDPIGTYHYLKRMAEEADIPCHVTVYPMVVDHLKKVWKERRERKRRWFTVKSAAKRVHEPELADLLLRLAADEAAQRLPRSLRKRL
ncbi:NUDIX hydrolase [Roseivivax isoporae]|nr:NUDIX hydrolase [Roseivivax isoporae]